MQKWLFQLLLPTVRSARRTCAHSLQAAALSCPCCDTHARQAGTSGLPVPYMAEPRAQAAQGLPLSTQEKHLGGANHVPRESGSERML